ncbi:MAG: calcium-binding EGF-like domain-containing protein [Bacteroidia bacterium]
MKNIFAIAILFITLFTFSTCRQDPAVPGPCDAIVCENGGTCDNGNCVCPTGYSGPRCETYYTTLLAGKYTSNNFNCGFFPLNGDADIAVNPENKDQLLLPQGLIADVSGNNFSVLPKSQLGVSIWGEGYFEGERMFLKLNIGSPITGVLSTCQGDFYKKK